MNVKNIKFLNLNRITLLGTIISISISATFVFGIIFLMNKVVSMQRTGDIARAYNYQLLTTNLYANGLQMGQATRNIMLDPKNKKAVENYNAAKDLYKKDAAAIQELSKSFQYEKNKEAEMLMTSSFINLSEQLFVL